MRCGRCGKHFDEEMYSGICPKCGHFNNKQAEYDVSKYFSARFEDGEKTSTSAQAQKQHAELHKMYDKYTNASKQHTELHRAYDKQDMHRSQQTKSYQAGIGNAQGKAGTYQQGNIHQVGKLNPYQQTYVQGNTYQAGQTGSYQQGSTYQTGQSGAYRQGSTYQTGQSGTYQRGSYPQRHGQAAKLNGEVKEKNIVTPICIVIAVLAILVSVLGVQIKKNNLSETYNTLDYEQQYAGVGELFEINDRLLMVEKAEVIDTSGLDGMPVGEKLVAVTVEILPTDDWKRDDMSGTVYVSDGYHCKQYLDSYVVNGFLGAQDVLTGYDYLSYFSAEEMTGRFYFFVDEDAGEITISFDEDKEEDTVFVLQKRVSVSLLLKEEGA